MNSTGLAEVICTIGCRLTPNSRKVTTVRSSKVTFPKLAKVDFKIVTVKS